MNERYTVDGSDALERHLADACDKVLAGVRRLIPASILEGLLLGGGYGRGEGGVLKTPAGDRPYNDLEFYVFVRGNPVLSERRYRRPLHLLGEELSREAGLDVEFKVLTLRKLSRSAPSMFFYDLLAGHRWQLGDDSLLSGCEHLRDPARIPLHEATRLLMNRCSGLIFSAERLARKSFGPAEADYVARNLAKAQLAFGDVVLAARGQYHWSCRERGVRLLSLAIPDLLPGPELIRHHAAGVAFKLHPVRSTEPRETLATRHHELSALGRRLWLWLERERLNLPFESIREYAFSPANLCPESWALRNWLLNIRTFRGRGLTCVTYPRQRLLQALALLLWEPELSSANALLSRLQSLLQTQEVQMSGWISAYERLWARFN